MRKTTLLIIASTALALSACAGQQVQVQPPVTVTPSPVSAPAPHDPLAGIAAFTVADLQAASTDAKAQVPPDVTASQCYDFLATVIPTLKLPNGGQTVGGFLAFQKARDLANGASSSNGALKSLNLACAPLVIDTQTVINKLAILGAGTAATGGALAPFAGALPAIGAVLPIPLP